MTAPVTIGRAGREWRSEMMRAIREAASGGPLFKAASLSCGLRVIRTFEAVNGRSFDPFDRYHREVVRGMGAHEAIRLRLRLQRLRQGKAMRPAGIDLITNRD
jgi:hypothetical protein